MAHRAEPTVEWQESTLGSGTACAKGFHLIWGHRFAPNLARHFAHP